MGMTFYEASDKLDITEHMEDIELNLGTGFRFIWNRDGIDRRIPHSVMNNVIRLFRAREEMVHAGRAVKFEPAIVEWDQCVDNQ